VSWPAQAERSVRRWLEIAPGLRLTGDGAAWLPGARAIVVADVHVGYELAAQRRGGYLPPIEDGAAIGARLVAMARELSASRVVVAGDLRHSTRDVDDFEREELMRLAAAFPSDVQLDVVRGNHDRGGTIVGRETEGTLRIGGTDVRHVPPLVRPVRWTVSGHLHPRVTVRDETGASARFPCALVGERLVVLPAFSDWAGGSGAGRLLDSLPSGEWRALPVSGGAIADVGILLKRDARAV
jgi:putative SbcD/Mre11-related phosphoesterase